MLDHVLSIQVNFTYNIFYYSYQVLSSNSNEIENKVSSEDYIITDNDYFRKINSFINPVPAKEKIKKKSKHDHVHGGSESESVDRVKGSSNVKSRIDDKKTHKKKKHEL